MLQDLVAKFVDRELMPLEPVVLAREASGGKSALTDEETAPLLAKCRELGLWGLDVPEEMGGANLPTSALMPVEEELARTVTPFEFPPDSPNLHMMLAVADAWQHHGVGHERRRHRQRHHDRDGPEPRVDRGDAGVAQCRERGNTAVHGHRSLHRQLDAGSHHAGHLGLVG